jgi:chitinase
MTMDYGASRTEEQSMADASKSALLETHRQLGILYKQAGINLSSISLWRKIGATPMIGQNDVVGEVFTLEDAKAFNEFARTQGVGRMSMWSANRDTPCGENYVDVKVVSDSCSGVKTPKFSFSEALSNGFSGDLVQSATLLTVEDPDSNTAILDDPAKSPYQIWQEAGAYPKGVKVVWHGNVYEAKWWTKNDLPDNPVLQSWETPWQLVGPVLLNEKPIEQSTLPEGTYRKWSGNVVYEEGDRVLFEGVPFQAKWWNEGESPAASAANMDASPWVALTQAQILNILEDLSRETQE